MQFVIIGAGNIGCVYGGNLARIGQDVAFLDIWEEHVARIRTDGLSLTGLTGDFTIRAQASTAPRDLPRADAVVVCVNAYSTADAATSVRTLLKPGGFCLTLQNGMGNVEILSEVLGQDRVLAGLSFQSGDLEGPARVRHTNNGPTYLGELDRSRTPRLAELDRLFAAAGLNPVVVDDVVATIWAKFVHNCGINAICAITGLRPGQICEVPELDRFQSKIIEETVALCRSKGVVLPDDDPVAAVKKYCADKFHRPSMMQHLARGGRTEIDSLNGYVAAESARLGLTAPFNEALTMLIKGREHRPAQ
ncbi:MAG TPA: ketopantoate reductase family protein [Bryobacteraceae bacterium]|nr:ketopantoate reductase family protein [Bryobacteraceae bacterium]